MEPRALTELVHAQLPPQIYYASEPLTADTEIETFDVRAFEERFGFHYSESLYTSESINQHLESPELHEEFQNSGQFSHIINNHIVTHRLQHPIEGLVVCNMGEEVGHGLFTRDFIPSGTILFLYAGVIETVNHSDNDAYSYHWVNSSHLGLPSKAINPSKTGGLARFMQHAPQDKNEKREKIKNETSFMFPFLSMLMGEEYTQELIETQLEETLKNNPNEHDIELENVIFKNKTACNNIITSNMIFVRYNFNGTPLTLCIADRDIQPCEMLTYSYGPSYWSKAGVEPHLFYRDGSIVPREHYTRHPENNPYYYPREVTSSSTASFFNSEENPLAIYKAGVKKYKNEDYNNAIEDIAHALRLFRQDEEAYHDNVITCLSTLASCYRELEWLEDAHQYCEEAIALAQNYYGETSQKIESLQKKLNSIEQASSAQHETKSPG